MKFPRPAIFALAIVFWVLPHGPALAAEPLTLLLWPAGKMPLGAPTPAKPETLKNAVTNPEITVHPAPGLSKPAPAILICPGGGYDHLAFDKEGTEIAAWLNTIGITGITLKYRVPNNRDGAFQDVQRAMRLVRTRAREWNIDASRIGVMGFSAGGHLSARLSTNFETPAYAAIDAVDSKSCRPDFTILVYPAYLDAKGGEGVASELHVSTKTAPTFIVHTEDDKAYIRGSKVYDAALTAANVPHEYFVVAKGGHGYGLRSTEEIKVWPDHLKAWLIKTGVL